MAVRNNQNKKNKLVAYKSNKKAPTSVTTQRKKVRLSNPGDGYVESTISLPKSGKRKVAVPVRGGSGVTGSRVFSKGGRYGGSEITTKSGKTTRVSQMSRSGLTTTDSYIRPSKRDNMKVTTTKRSSTIKRMGAEGPKRSMVRKKK